jgi:hypothetical protein
MNRLVSLLLIPIFMLGHELPHSHAGTGVVEPEGHSLRPHVHVSVDHDHDHDDDGHKHHHTGSQSEPDSSETATTATLSVPTDHDSDAVYFVDIDWTASRTVAGPQIDTTTLVWTSLAPSDKRDRRLGCRIVDPPDRYAGLPIYLLTASLRL